MTTSWIRRMSLSALALAATTPALAQDAPLLRARSLAATCANCHGNEGKPPSGSAMVPLAGMPAAHFLARMKTFKENAQPSATVMHQVAQGFSEAQIQLMAEYFASKKR